MMRSWQKILLTVFHVIGLLLIVNITMNGLQLRWRLGYILFEGVALSGISLYFMHFHAYILNVITKLYAFCWGLFSVIGVLVACLTFDSVYCETDRYIMKKPASIIGFDSAILYEKNSLLETEKRRYKFVSPKSIVPLDSIGAIIIYGDYDNGEGKSEYDVAILPLDDSYFSNKDKIREYAKLYNMKFEP